VANTLTNLYATAFEALDVVSRETVGFIPSVSINANGSQRVAKNQNVTIPVTRPSAAADIAPGQLPPDTGDQTVDPVTMTITKVRGVPVRWNGEEATQLNVNGVGFNPVLRDQFAQAMRTLCNEIEVDLGALYPTSRLGYYSSGSGQAAKGMFSATPGISDLAFARKLLVDQGAPNDLRLVVDTLSGANLRSLSNLYKANEAGGDAMLRRGILQELYGIPIRESAGVATHTAGTASSSTVSNAGYAAGVQTVLLSAVGTGTLVPGDLITIAGENANYPHTVLTGCAAVQTSGQFTLNSGGLFKAASAATKAIVVAGTGPRPMLFSQSAMHLLLRAPALVGGVDSAATRIQVTDPVSQLTFEIAEYREYRRTHYEVCVAWGVANIKPQHVIQVGGQA
jgi:P22 coat protein - gene protein 5